jgi:hypothetical protein
MEGIIHPDHLAQHDRSSSQPNPDGITFWAPKRSDSPQFQPSLRSISQAPSDSDTVGGGDRKPSLATSSLSYDSVESSARSYGTGSTSRKGSIAESYRHPSTSGSSTNLSPSGAGPSRFAPSGYASRKGSSLSSSSLKRRSSSTFGKAAVAKTASPVSSDWTAPESWAVKQNPLDNPQETASDDSEPEPDMSNFRGYGKNLPLIGGGTSSPGAESYNAGEATTRDSQRPETAGSSGAPKNLQVTYDAFGCERTGHDQEFSTRCEFSKATPPTPLCCVTLASPYRKSMASSLENPDS